MNLHIEHAVFNLSPSISQEALDSMERMMQSIGRAAAPDELKAAHAKPQIGEYWPGQGGFYAGDMRGDDGMVYGLILADCGEPQDLGRVKWGPTGKRDLSDWDGLTNIQALGGEYPAAKLAAGHAADEHHDFYLPARRELQLACATVPHLFGRGSWYWSSTPYSDDYAWAVDFEDGDTLICHRDDEFRVRPFRRFIY